MTTRRAALELLDAGVSRRDVCRTLSVGYMSTYRWQARPEPIAPGITYSRCTELPRDHRRGAVGDVVMSERPELQVLRRSACVGVQPITGTGSARFPSMDRSQAPAGDRPHTHGSRNRPSVTRDR
jgi:hypothetical protein